MYHAVFQILVDFVELEQPFRAWDDPKKYKERRHTNRSEMHAFIEKYRKPYLEPDMPSDMVEMFTQQAKDGAEKDAEVLSLYEWYKDEGYEFDRFKYREMVGEKIVIGDDGQVAYVDTGTPKTLTWEEYHAMEQAHRELCEANLQRVLKIRGYLWT